MNKFAVLLLLLMVILFNISFSQSNYLVNLENVIRVDDFTYKFDIYIESTDHSFELTSYQCAFQYETNDISDDNFTFSFTDGSSELINKPIFGISSTITDGHHELTFASNAGSDMIENKKIKIGTFIFKRQKKFEDFTIAWNFDGTNATILTGKDFDDITDSANFKIPNTLTGINSKNSQVISDHQLFQNYPNPFNPSTKIKYSIPTVETHRDASVQLIVYDVLGKELITLVNKEQSAGTYEVTFDASNFASGVYFYQLTILPVGRQVNNGQFSSVKKMILTK